MDEMEAHGLLVRPEDHGIYPTHVYDSYLAPKLDYGVPTGRAANCVGSWEGAAQ